MRRLGGARRIFRSALLLMISALLSSSPAAAAKGVFGPPKVGEKAPPFEIRGFNSKALQGKKHILLVFYRGFF